MNPEEIILKNQLATRLRERIQIAKENGLLYYRPHAKQDAFHRAGKFKRRMVRAGNRFGKSQMGCAEDVAWCRGLRPWYEEGDVARYEGIPQHPVKGLIITTDWDKVDEIWTSERGDNPGKLWKYVPQNAIISKRRNHSGAIDMVEIKSALYEGTSVLRFDTVKSFMANPMGQESSDWDFIHVDEPCPQAMYKAAARGLVDRGGSSWFTLTPLSEPWINDLFFPGMSDGEVVDENGHSSLWSITGTIYDNPYLTPQAIAEYESLLTDEEKQCRLHGLPLHLAGLVYKEFDRAKHVLPRVPYGWIDYHLPPPHYSVYVAIDPHPQTPHAVLFAAISPEGYVFIYDELYHHSTIEELCTLYHLKTTGKFVVRTKCDPWVYNKDPITGATYADDFAKHGVYIERGSKDLSRGILHTKAALKRDNYIYVAPTCKRFLWEIGRYSWDKDNKPVDKDDHMMENFRRILLDDPMYVRVSADRGANIQDEEIVDPSLSLDDTGDDWL